MPYTVLRLKYTVLQHKAATAFNTIDVLNAKNLLRAYITETADRY